MERSYAGLAELKLYLAIDSDGEDVLLSAILERASAIIDAATSRRFIGEIHTCYFGADDDNGGLLDLSRYDLLSIISVRNGNGALIPLENIRLLPRNTTPKWMIKLLNGARFDYSDDVEVTGTWGYSETPPEDIMHACIRLAAFIYRQKDNAGDLDRPMVTGDGVTIMPSALPSDVNRLLKQYVKVF